MLEVIPLPHPTTTSLSPSPVLISLLYQKKQMKEKNFNKETIIIAFIFRHSGFYLHSHENYIFDNPKH